MLKNIVDISSLVRNNIYIYTCKQNTKFNLKQWFCWPDDSYGLVSISTNLIGN